MRLPEQVTLIEVGPRDGFQFEEKLIPTELKAEVIDALAGAGLRRVQVTSFVHPRWVSQMADAEEVCRRLQKREGTVYSGLVVNRKGVERARAAGLTCVDLSVSASDTHSRKNANMSLDQAILHMKEMIALAGQYGMQARAGVQCAFGCAYEGVVPAGRVLSMVEKFLDFNVDSISLADSTGMANPRSVKELLSQLLPLTRKVPVTLHLHDTRGMGLANVVAALDSGVSRFDTALAGMGGCPFIPGAAGNIATEDTAYLLESMGVTTGVDIAKVAQCSRRIEDFLGKRFPGKMHHLPVC